MILVSEAGSTSWLGFCEAMVWPVMASTTIQARAAITGLEIVETAATSTRADAVFDVDRLVAAGLVLLPETVVVCAISGRGIASEEAQISETQRREKR